ncbi:MAG: tRNA (adenosine(37)-N6)-threonylcarbamoyltransferase complex dimerization subunit type 1 TsaB [Clostridia bacterium]|nr:tRNA (adenosine(37)-N6)-threonylcarbamoyltransferase complex dimerization subunit type 1 TsaB [Clostridia bacterium]
MNILALETTDKVASVALLTDDGCRQLRIESPLRHEETVMPAVDELLSVAGLSPADLAALAVDVGPGSFTGVRIGVCHGNAMALALGVPVVSVNALEALAWPLLGGSRPVAAIIDARNGNGYGALYGPDGAVLLPPCAIEIEPFLQSLPKDALLTGTGFSEADGALPLAESIARIAARRVGEKAAQPLYLRPSQAERKQKA